MKEDIHQGSEPAVGVGILKFQVQSSLGVWRGLVLKSKDAQLPLWTLCVCGTPASDSTSQRSCNTGLVV